MCDLMSFPNTPIQFVNQYSFRDAEEHYTNGRDIIEVSRVEQMLDHYFPDKKNVCKYKIITLCGSTKFKDDFIRMQKQLTVLGNIVLSVDLFEHSGDSGFIDPNVLKGTLDDMHKRKIDMSDEIIVINKNGYIGDSTREDIIYAETHGKRVVYLYPLEKYGMGVDEYISQHTDIHYCEAVIYPDGTINDARPNHLSALIDFTGKSKEDIDTLMPEFACPINWLVSYTKCVAVWYNSCIACNTLTKEQIDTIRKLREAKIIANDGDMYYTDEYSTCERIKKER